MARDARALNDERIQRLVEAGWRAFHLRRERWLRAVVARLRGLAGDAPEVVDLSWRLAYVRGTANDALEEALRGVALYPDDADLSYAAGWCLIELRAYVDAVPHLRRACELNDGLVDAWYDLGVALEQLGDEDGVREAFTRVHELDVERLSGEPRLFDADEFTAIVQAALDELPEPVSASLGNVAVIVEDYPDPWILEEPPYDPRLFGLFVGPTYADARGTSTTGDEPSRIYVYQANLERQFQHPADLREEIRVTLIHEVGHYLGLSEIELADRGWL